MKPVRDYQTGYTENPVARRKMYELQVRADKAAKIVAVLQDGLGDLGSASVLDMSCSTGMMTAVLARHARRVVGIDIDAEAVEFARATHRRENLEFQVMDALGTLFSEGSFDVVICNQMYEHVPDPERLMREIFRILTPGGVCYFGATNRLKVIETHYGNLPFLSYLPKPLANLYLRLSGRGQHYYETLYTCPGLRRLTRDFELLDYTEAIVRDPVKFHATEMVSPGGWGQRLALAGLRWTYWAFPGYVWLLRKPEDPVTPR